MAELVANQLSTTLQPPPLGALTKPLVNSVLFSGTATTDLINVPAFTILTVRELHVFYSIPQKYERYTEHHTTTYCTAVLDRSGLDRSESLAMGNLSIPE